MVLGPWVTPTADDAFKTAAVALDTKMEAASNKGRRWQYVRVGCSDAPYLDRRHFSPAGAGQILRAHRSTSDSFFNNE
jgi:hypothetical protein